MRCLPATTYRRSPQLLPATTYRPPPKVQSAVICSPSLELLPATTYVPPSKAVPAKAYSPPSKVLPAATSFPSLEILPAMTYVPPSKAAPAKSYSPSSQVPQATTSAPPAEMAPTATSSPSIDILQATTYDPSAKPVPSSVYSSSPDLPPVTTYSPPRQVIPGAAYRQLPDFLPNTRTSLTNHLSAPTDRTQNLDANLCAKERQIQDTHARIPDDALGTTVFRCATCGNQAGRWGTKGANKNLKECMPCEGKRKSGRPDWEPDWIRMMHKDSAILTIKQATARRKAAVAMNVAATASKAIPTAGKKAASAAEMTLTAGQRAASSRKRIVKATGAIHEVQEKAVSPSKTIPAAGKKAAPESSKNKALPPIPGQRSRSPGHQPRSDSLSSSNSGKSTVTAGSKGSHATKATSPPYSPDKKRAARTPTPVLVDRLVAMHNEARDTALELAAAELERELVMLRLDMWDDGRYGPWIGGGDVPPKGEDAADPVEIGGTEVGAREMQCFELEADARPVEIGGKEIGAQEDRIIALRDKNAEAKATHVVPTTKHVARKAKLVSPGGDSVDSTGRRGAAVKGSNGKDEGSKGKDAAAKRGRKKDLAKLLGPEVGALEEKGAAGGRQKGVKQAPEEEMVEVMWKQVDGVICGWVV